MPGRQMAIDADLSAGVIDEKQAQRRRSDVTRQADFFGAMDGASKFVRGDAIAGIVIILINIVGGLFIGVVESGMSVRTAAEVFSKLTIGDGLVTQVPAFLISIAAALLVTRSTEETDLPAQFIRQLFTGPEALIVTAVFLGFLTFTRLPLLPLLLIGGICVAVAVSLQRGRRRARDAAAQQSSTETKQVEQRVEQYLAIDPMEIEIGIGLIRLADPKRGGDLLGRVQRVRQAIAAEIGIVMPKVRIRDNTRLDQNQYQIKVADVPVADGHIRPGMLLAIPTADVTESIAGAATHITAFEKTGVWVEQGQRRDVETQGYTVWDPATIVTHHLTVVVRKHAADLLTRDATRHLIDELKTTAPAAVDELIPGLMKLAEVQQVLHLLLREGVSIRHLGLILETLGDCAPRTTDSLALAELVRQRLARSICARYRDGEHRLRVLTLDPELEDRIRASCEQTDSGITVRMPPPARDAICRLIREEAENLVREDHPAVVLVSPQIRVPLKQITAAGLPNLVVLSYAEITQDTHVDCLAMITDAVGVAA
jgi:flagellar biosynthesis protein FlhA